MTRKLVPQSTFGSRSLSMCNGARMEWTQHSSLMMNVWKVSPRLFPALCATPLHPSSWVCVLAVISFTVTRCNWERSWGESPVSWPNWVCRWLTTRLCGPKLPILSTTEELPSTRPPLIQQTMLENHGTALLPSHASTSSCFVRKCYLLASSVTTQSAHARATSMSFP